MSFYFILFFFFFLSVFILNFWLSLFGIFFLLNPLILFRTDLIRHFYIVHYHCTSVVILLLLIHSIFLQNFSKPKCDFVFRCISLLLSPLYTALILFYFHSIFFFFVTSVLFWHRNNSFLLLFNHFFFPYIPYLLYWVPQKEYFICFYLKTNNIDSGLGLRPPSLII